MREPSKIKKQKFEEIIANLSIYFQDESSFEVSHKVWRVLVPSLTKPFRNKGIDWRHDCLSVSWVRSIEWKFIYESSKSKKWKDFLSLVRKVRGMTTEEWMILILDNASIHKTVALREYCEKKKILLVYLPPYSPDLNPIELFRRMLKKEFRKIQWKHNNIKKSVLIASRKLKKRISKIDISTLVNIF